MKGNSPKHWTGFHKWFLVAVAGLVLIFSPAWGETQNQRQKSTEDVDRRLQEVRERSQALELELKDLHAQRRELEWEKKQTEMGRQIAEMRNEADRLSSAGNSEEATRLEESARLLERQLELEDQLWIMQAERAQQARELEAQLKERAQELERLSRNGDKRLAQEAHAALERQRQQAEREALQFESEMAAVRAQQEELLVESERRRAERLRFLGREKEAQELLQQLENRRHKKGTVTRFDVYSEKAAAAERELLKLNHHIEQLEAAGRTEEAEVLRAEIAGRKLQLREMLQAKKAYELRKIEAIHEKKKP